MDLAGGNLVRDLAGSYIAKGPLSEEDILVAAETILAEPFKKQEALTSPAQTKRYLVHRLAVKEHEVFSVIFLDQRHRIITYEEMFRGTIDRASIHPREVVKRSLQLNAAAVILAHNHPSGSVKPSRMDIDVTRQLQETLELVGTRILDHIIVGGAETCSFAEDGHL
ncbi:MAG: DNA repair protein RadC [Candidatus Thiodiazotropha lotti]|nr:DNA repair protein RadC [Candidatus Thiodiazotropha lotti]